MRNYSEMGKRFTNAHIEKFLTAELEKQTDPIIVKWCKYYRMMAKSGFFSKATVDLWISTLREEIEDCKDVEEVNEFYISTCEARIKILTHIRS